MFINGEWIDGRPRFAVTNPAAGDWYITVWGFSPGSATQSVGYSRSTPELTN